MAKIEDYLKNKDLQNKRENNRLSASDVKTLINDFLRFNPFKSEWIINGTDKNMIDSVEVMGKFLAPNYRDDKDALTNSQIRNIFGEIKRIQMGGFEENKASFLILKPKVAYAAGRHNKLGILTFKKYFDLASQHVVDNKTYQNFCNYLESIVAYHKAYGGKD